MYAQYSKPHVTSLMGWSVQFEKNVKTLLLDLENYQDDPVPCNIRHLVYCLSDTRCTWHKQWGLHVVDDMCKSYQTAVLKSKNSMHYSTSCVTVTQQCHGDPDSVTATCHSANLWLLGCFMSPTCWCCMNLWIVQCVMLSEHAQFFFTCLRIQVSEIRPVTIHNWGMFV